MKKEYVVYVFIFTNLLKILAYNLFRETYSRKSSQSEMPYVYLHLLMLTCNLIFFLSFSFYIFSVFRYSYKKNFLCILCISISSLWYQRVFTYSLHWYNFPSNNEQFCTKYLVTLYFVIWIIFIKITIFR